jgi:hypothetical protein
MHDVVIVRGTSGIGKSSVLQVVARRHRGFACIDVDAVWCMLSLARWTSDEHPLALCVSADLTRSFVRHGRRVVLACSTDDTEHALLVDGLRGLSCRTIVLVATDDIVENRIRARLAVDPHAYDDVRCACELNESLRSIPTHVDTSRMTIDQVADAVMATDAG